jgi:hypothetical protein
MVAAINPTVAFIIPAIDYVVGASFQLGRSTRQYIWLSQQQSCRNSLSSDTYRGILNQDGSETFDNARKAEREASSFQFRAKCDLARGTTDHRWSEHLDIKLTHPSAHRALQNPKLFTSDHYKQAAIAVGVGIAIRLAITIPVGTPVLNMASLSNVICR